MFTEFKKFDNFFSTTISVLASAVQKISRVTCIKPGQVLYRGLGGTTELPDLFHKKDDNGCHGFVEWAFMSTTSIKQVAIDYCGISSKKPLPYLLSFEVGSADRGALIRDFSQYVGEVEYLFVPCSFVQKAGDERLEVTKAGVVRVIPVKVNSNLKTETVEELVTKKRDLHLAAFRYRIDEIKKQLKDVAETRKADERLEQDRTREGYSVQLFLDKIVEQCKNVYSLHEAVSIEDFNSDRKFRSMVRQMVDIKDMAMSKLEEWLENREHSFIAYRFNAALRTVHRRWAAYLQRKLDSSDSAQIFSDKAAKLSLKFLKTRAIVVDKVDEKNELGETRIMAIAAEGNRDIKILDLLVQASACVNDARPDGVTALWLAAQFNHCEIVQHLIKLKADVNQAANDGATPAYIAAQGGNVDCIEVLSKLNANLDQSDKNGLAPMHQAAINGHEYCLTLLIKLGASPYAIDKNGKTPLDHAVKPECRRVLEPVTTPVATPFASESPSGQQSAHLTFPSDANPIKLIISSGDISDVDGYFALVEYAKTGADVLFVMNYPAYIGVQDSEVDPAYSMQTSRDADILYSEQNPGLGYKYSVRDVLENLMSPETDSEKWKPHMDYYNRFLKGYIDRGAVFNMKHAMTDMAFTIVNRVWAETETEKRGNLFFCIGGVNSINPFSRSAIKNEVLVYSHLVPVPDKYFSTIQQERVYGSDGNECKLDFDSYQDIYIDFNGSFAFWDGSWESTLSKVVNKIRGVFVMGGVFSDEKPVTMPSIPGILNRFSSATMNQLYHPQGTAQFFAFLDQHKHKFSTFCITNNVVKDMDKTKTYDGVKSFMSANGLTGTFLQGCAVAHYLSPYSPPRKAYDFYTALALTTWMNSKHSHEALTANKMSMFYSNVYGITYVSKHETWEETRAAYVEITDIVSRPGDNEVTLNKKDFFRKEIRILNELEFVGKLEGVFAVHFKTDDAGKLKVIQGADQVATLASFTCFIIQESAACLLVA